MPYRFPSDAAFRRWDIPRRKTCARCPSKIPGFPSNRIAWRIPLVASGQSENEMSNDVPLHFGGPCLDSVSARAQVAIRPNPFIDGTRVAAQQLTVGTEQLLRDLLKALVELAPENLLNGTLRARHAGHGDAAECPHLVEAHDFNFRAALREFLADERVLGSGPTVALDASGKFNKARDGAFEYKMKASAVGTALVHQRAHGHIPSIIHVAENIFSWNANIAKEKLIEFGLPGHLAQRTNLDPRRFHVHQQD